MNLSEASQELANRGFDYLEGSRRNFMLNTARSAFEDFWHWPWLERVVTGPAPLAIDSLKYVVYVQNVDLNAELLYLDIRQVAQNGTPVDMPGIPAYWWLDGPPGGEDSTVNLNVWPVGPATLQARVVVETPELSDPDDTPLIPVRYHSLWIDYAVIEGYKDSDNFVAAQQLRADLTGRMQDVVLRYETRNRQHKSFLDSRWPYAEDA